MRAFRALQVEAIAKEIEELKPVTVVLDLMLFTSSGAAKAAAAAFQRSISALEARSRSEEPPKRWATAGDASAEIPTMASDWLRALKKKMQGSLEELVAGAIAKRLDTKTRLLNGKEFAEKVRELIKG